MSDPTAPKQYAIPLGETTPEMEGQPVRDAQWLLQGNNRFPGLNPLKDVKINGVYGSITAQATRRAKYWLGYPSASIDGVFGQTLYEYLRQNHWRPLPPDYRARRAVRLANAAETIGDKALDWAITQIGYEENPYGSNKTKYGVEYGWNGVAWCAIFDSIAFKHSGYPNFHYASVPWVASDAIYGRNRLSIVLSPRRGDLALHTVGGKPNAHISFFEEWITQGHTYHDVGGNTGPSDISNGGAVMRQVRYSSNVTHWVRVT